MNDLEAQPQSAQTGDEVKQEAMAYRQQAMEAADRARVNLGTAAAGQEVSFDSHGNMLTDKDKQELQARGPEINR